MPFLKKQAAFIFGGWVLILLAMYMMWSAPIISGELTDPDDYMRMVRVFDLLDGHGGPSYAAPRLGVDGQAENPWSRIVDIPLAAVQGALEFFMPRIPAALMTATIFPAFALLLLLLAGRWYVRPLLVGRSDIFTILTFLFLWAMLRQFIPGRVDHHMAQVLLGVTAYGALVRCWFKPERMFYPALAGGGLATGLAIGADSLMWTALGTALLGIFWLGRGRSYEKAGVVFGGSLFAAALGWHIILHAQERFFQPFCDSLSLPWVGLAVIVAAFWGIVYMNPAGVKDTALKRFLLGGVVTVPLLAALYGIFPACFHDPYMIDDPLVREIWLDMVREARAIPALYKDNPMAAYFFAVPPVIALVGALWALYAEKQDRILWAGLAFLTFVGAALSFYQIRTVDFAQAVALAPMAWLLVRLFDVIGNFIGRFKLTRRQRLGAASSFFAASLILFAFAAAHRDQEKQEQKELKAESCVLRQAIKTLNTLPDPEVISAFIDEGTEILFFTPHKVLAAPYHRNEEGILAAYHILSAPDFSAAYKLVSDSNVGIIMVCDDPGNYWTGGKSHRSAPFAASLLRKDIPDWLEQVSTLEESGGYVILRVKNGLAAEK